MKRSVLHVLSQEYLDKMPTKQLLGRLRRLHECQESAAVSDFTADEIAASKGILFKDSPEWVVAFQQVKRVLATREHVPSAADRATRRQARGRMRSERKSNETLQWTAGLAGGSNRALLPRRH
jgi:hypothetical protein